MKTSFVLPEEEDQKCEFKRADGGTLGSSVVALDWSEGRAAAESELHRLRAVGRA